jgi:tripartite-type tricarboxylate transporter receptor subunit TctC
LRKEKKMKRKKMNVMVTMVTFLLLTLIGVSHAQTDYPVKPVTIIVPYNAGGMSDILGRLIAERATKYFPKPIVVVNRSGASGIVGLTEVVNAKPDGYTLGLADSGSGASKLHAIKATYTIDSYQIVSNVGLAAQVILTAGPWNTMKELVEYSRANPNKITAGNSGRASFGHLQIQNFALSAGLKWRDIPFTGEAPVITAVMGKHVDIGCATITGALTHYRGGSLKILAVCFPERLNSIPDIPTAKELGYEIPVIASNHYIIVANGTPQPIIDKLSAMMKKIIEDPEYQKKVTNFSYTSWYLSGPEQKKVIKNWFDISKELYVRLDLIPKK